MKAIPLIATNIHFNFHSIVYDVRLDSNKDIGNSIGFSVCSFDIKDKDLILKPTILDKDNMRVVFTPANVIPHFYEAIFKKVIRHLSEYEVEKKNIYNIGEIVGYIMI